MPPCPYSVEFVDQEEDLLPEVIQGDFLWLQNMQDSDDMYYDTRVKSANVFMRGSLAVLKLSLQVPKSFNLDRGAQFLLRLRLNRVTLRRQYHALSSLLTHLRRVLFPSPSDIKPFEHLSNNINIANLRLSFFDKNIRENGQQLRTVVSILRQPKGTVPFIIFGP